MQKLAKALLTFRKEIESIKKDADNPFFKSKYADLSSILEGIKNPLEKSGLALTHYPRYNESGYMLVSTLIEVESGENLQAEFPIFWNKAQEIGSSITYARRYNTLAILDIPTDEDDDGNIANTATRTKSEYVGWTAKKWLNFRELKKAIEWWTDTEILLTQWILDNEFDLSGAMKQCLRTYCDTGELIEPEWKK